MSNDLLKYYAYNGLFAVLSPIAAGYCVWSAVRSRRPGSALLQQLGILPSRVRRASSEFRVWAQAVSVGETVAAGPVLAELKKLMPSAELILSTTTTAGNYVANKSLSDANEVIYFPLDIAPAVSKALDTVRPDVFASVETEIWPNFLYHCRKRGIPTVIINGCISDRTYRWGKKIRWLYRWALRGVDKLCMQSAEDAARVVELGARPERVEIVGNCKFDELSAGVSDEERRRIGDCLGVRNGSPTFVAGSTNPGEEEQTLDAFRYLRKKHKDLKLIVAPRQLDRVASIEGIVASFGFSSGRRSESEKLTGKEDVVILDTMGELASVYSVATVAFVGGSLIPKGGHNILQPIAQGRPVVFGPYMHKTRDLVRIAMQAGVGFQVADAADLGRTVDRLLGDPGKLKEISDKARSLIAQNRGAARRCAEAIAALCPS